MSAVWECLGLAVAFTFGWLARSWVIALNRAPKVES